MNITLKEKEILFNYVTKNVGGKRYLSDKNIKSNKIIYNWRENFERAIFG